jgi:molybdenum cofactor biosynthesis enzyme MoaA
LKDELGRSFYDALEPMLGELRLLAASGGEPLASREFQAFLGRIDAARYPQLRVSMTTNLSYFTPTIQERLSNVPWGGLTVSLNAATSSMYALVNRGLPYERVRRNLDALYERRAKGTFDGKVTYNFVVLRANVDEIEAIADLSFADGADVDYLLPHYNRHNESIFVHEPEMRRALAALESVASKERERGRDEISREAAARATVLRQRLEQRLFEPNPSESSAPEAPLVALKDLVLRAKNR